MKKSSLLFTFGILILPIALLITQWDGVIANDTPTSADIFADKAASQEMDDISIEDYIDSETMTADSLGNCRYGASELGGASNAPFITEMNLGWKNNFQVNFATKGIDTANYTPTIRLYQIPDGDGDNTNDSYGIKKDGATELELTDDPSNGLGYQVTQNPGVLWLVGNEPDRAVAQDALYPQVYARAYHDIYHFIKERDPSAEIAVAGLVQVSENRLQYLTLMWDAYLQYYGTPMPVDVWNMHAYAFPERRFDNTNIYAWVALGTDRNNALYYSEGDPSLCGQADVRCIAEHDDIDILKQQITDMRLWMKERGQQQKPLVISEYGLLFPYEQDTPTQCFIEDEFGNCFTEQRNVDFANNSFALLESYIDPALGYSLDNNRMVQQWLWFATRSEPQNKYKLVNEEGTALTSLGVAFRDQIQTKPLIGNLFFHSASAAPVELQNSTATGAVSLVVINNGTQAIIDPITISLYSDAALTNEVSSIVLEGGVRGCTTDLAHAEIEWPNLSAGIHQYWIKIDSNNQFDETSETDNVITGSIYVDQPTIYLPTIRK